MNMRQLEAFRATMRSGSITEAAEMMHLSQPSVSRLIIDLEHAVGFPLFIRSGRGLSPRFPAGGGDFGLLLILSPPRVPLLAIWSAMFRAFRECLRSA